MTVLRCIFGACGKEHSSYQPFLLTPYLAFALLFGVFAQLQAEEIIENSLYIVKLNPSTGSFKTVYKATGLTFLEGGKLSGNHGTASTIELTDPILGKGKGVEIIYPDGNREVVALYDGLPFVTFRSTFHNSAAEPVILNHVSGVSATVDLGQSGDKLTTLGTAGLRAPENNPGSYAFLAVAEPQTRNGVVAGWITEDRGSGVIFSPTAKDHIKIRAQIDYGRMRLKPGADALGELLGIGYFEDARFGLEDYANAVRQNYSIKLHPEQPGFCTWYMEKYGNSSDEKHLSQLSAYAAKNMGPYGFGFIQIDDEWQQGLKANGPRKNFTASRPDGPYPNGMKAAADMIKGYGLTPGIWFMPFAGNDQDPFFKQHEDWFAKTASGAPYDTAWGGTCLDMTNPDTQAYVRSVVSRIAHAWGYQLFKMDGFYTGSAVKQIYVNSGYHDDGMGDAVFSNPDKTNIEALRDGVKLVRDAAGPNVFLLGCTVSQNMRSFGGSFGLLDAMRVGPDTGSSSIGAIDATRLWFLNGRVWWNDPDCVNVRSTTPLDQARLNASFAAIAGTVFYDSDWMPDLPPDRLNILRRCMPAHGLPSRPVDVFENHPARIWHLADASSSVRRDIVALFNYDKDPIHISYPLDRIGLPPADQYVGFDFWANRFIRPFRGNIESDMPPGGSCRVLALQPLADHPRVVSTSRHITQGIVDLRDEQWNAPADTLSGASSVVGKDPYELRVLVPVGSESWNLQSIQLAQEDTAAGVRTTFIQDGPKIRATLNADSNREVHWTMQFKTAPVAVQPPPPVKNLNETATYNQVQLKWESPGADEFQIIRSDGKTFETCDASFLDSTIRQGVDYQYSVASVGWDGISGVPSELSVKAAAITPPPAPPKPTIDLSQSNTRFLENGGSTASFNRSVSGRDLSVAGKSFQKGLGVQAGAVAIVTMPPDAFEFVSIVGIDQAALKDSSARLVFEVYGDVKEMGEPPVLLAQSPTLSSIDLTSWAFDVTLNSRFKEIRLVVKNVSPGSPATAADWVDAGFLGH